MMTMIYCHFGTIEKKMKYSNLFLIFLVTFLYLIEINAVDSQDELLWINSMGNVRNTRRLKPSTPTEYTGKNWNYIFNSSSQHTTIFGAGVGINGDLYTYISDSQYSSGLILTIEKKRLYLHRYFISFS